MQRYRSSGRASATAIIVLVVVSVAAGIVSGVGIHAASNLIRVFLIFPLIMGGVAGVAAAVVVTMMKIRAPILAGAIGFAAGMTGWITDVGLDYAHDRNELAQGIAAATSAGHEDLLAGITGDPVDAVLAMHDPEAALAGGWRAKLAALEGYLQQRAAAGTQIVSVGRSHSASTLGETGTLILWALELFLLGGAVAAWMAWKPARQPFCEKCSLWYKRAGVTRVGNAGEKAGIKSALERDDINDLALRAVEHQPVSAECITLHFKHCCASSPVFVRLVHVKPDTRNPERMSEKELARGVLANDALVRFARAVRRHQGSAPSLADDRAA